MTRLAALTAAALVAAFLMPAAWGQGMPVVCKSHADMSKHLKTNFGEVVIAMGLAGPGALFELYASTAGTWTVILTRPSMANLSCIQGAGTDFELTGNEPPPIKKNETPA